MLPRLFATLMLCLLATSSFAETPNAIAALCKKQYPGDKGLQSFCLKEKRNYQEWLKYVRKRVYSDASQRNKVDSCVHSYKPNYREAYDCVFGSNWFSIQLF